jgi:hypothetical protein
MATVAHTQDPNYQTGKIVAMFLNELSKSSKEITSEKIARQQAALADLDSALSYLERTRPETAYFLAERAMTAFPKYSLSYLIMAYSALEKEDFLNANRMLRLYHRYKGKAYNEKLAINVPDEFIKLVETKTASGYDALSGATLRKQFKTEPWMNTIMQLQIHPSASIFLGDNWGVDVPPGVKADDPAEIMADNMASLFVKQYIWLNRRNSLPYTNNNIGVCLDMGVDYSFLLPNTYFPPHFKAYVQPGIVIHKVYLSPGQFRYYKLPDYPDPYNGYDGFKHPYFGFLINPEIRYYPGVINAYATDFRKLPKSLRQSAKFTFGYFFLKMQQELLSGSKGVDAYTREREYALLGFNLYMGKNRGTEFGMFFGYGDIARLTETRANIDYNVSGDYYRFGIKIAKRIL